MLPVNFKVGKDIYMEGVYDESIAYFIHGKVKKIAGDIVTIEAYKTDYPGGSVKGYYLIDWTYCTAICVIENYGPLEARMGIIKPSIKVKVKNGEPDALLIARKRMKIGDVVMYRGERFTKVKNGMVKVASNHVEYEIIEV